MSPNRSKVVLFEKKKRSDYEIKLRGERLERVPYFKDFVRT